MKRAARVDALLVPELLEHKAILRARRLSRCGR
jgi:hypothetical protein